MMSTEFVAFEKGRASFLGTPLGMAASWRRDAAVGEDTGVWCYTGICVHQSFCWVKRSLERRWWCCSWQYGVFCHTLALLPAVCRRTSSAESIIYLGLVFYLTIMYAPNCVCMLCDQTLANTKTTLFLGHVCHPGSGSGSSTLAYNNVEEHCDSITTTVQ